ncbi:MAG: 16S rRNA (cytosine(1402)-N(4))-methyltransferase RsmH [Gemmatimonadota bacterium]|nr:16S rRNA (cytosine(1402)-N(4))-methyltransferase RsmH [Gemmatimonadota bacterium]
MAGREAKGAGGDHRHAADTSRPPRILDGTLGGGGHSEALLAAGADVTGLDQDPAAIAAAGARLRRFVDAGRFRTVQANFADFAATASGEFDGILLDLGVSSHQLDDAGRGFSFRPGAPLDMRMQGFGPTAADFLNTEDRARLAGAFREYGDERRAMRLASEVVRRRANRPFVVSDDFVGAIRAVLGPLSGPPDFARLFQAVRIAVNDEMGALERALPALRDRLAPSGVFVVITYHSGEDRLVKHAFRDWSRSCTCPPRQPVCTCGGDNALGDVVTRKAIVAAADEILRNARARSAKLRAWRRRAGRPARTR